MSSPIFRILPVSPRGARLIRRVQVLPRVHNISPNIGFLSEFSITLFTVTFGESLLPSSPDATGEVHLRIVVSFPMLTKAAALEQASTLCGTLALFFFPLFLFFLFLFFLSFSHLLI